jgi:hypothetical protein
MGHIVSTRGGGGGYEVLKIIGYYFMSKMPLELLKYFCMYYPREYKRPVLTVLLAISTSYQVMEWFHELVK